MAIFNESGAVLSVGNSAYMNESGMSVLEYATCRCAVDEIIESLTIDLAANERAYDFLTEAGLDIKAKAKAFAQWVEGLIDKLIDGFNNLIEKLRHFPSRVAFSKEKEKVIREKWDEIKKGGKGILSENDRKNARFVKALTNYNAGNTLLANVNAAAQDMEHESGNKEAVYDRYGKILNGGKPFTDNYQTEIKNTLYGERDVELKDLNIDNVIKLAKEVNQTIPSIKKTINTLMKLRRSLSKKDEADAGQRLAINITVYYAKESISVIKNGISAAIVICNTIYKGKVGDTVNSAYRKGKGDDKADTKQEREPSLYDDDDETYIPH